MAAAADAARPLLQAALCAAYKKEELSIWHLAVQYQKPFLKTVLLYLVFLIITQFPEKASAGIAAPIYSDCHRRIFGNLAWD